MTSPVSRPPRSAGPPAVTETTGTPRPSPASSSLVTPSVSDPWVATGSAGERGRVVAFSIRMSSVVKTPFCDVMTDLTKPPRQPMGIQVVKSLCGEC